MIRMEAPYSFKHILWHAILGWLMLVDALISILSLGLFVGESSLKWIEGSGNWLYNHDVILTDQYGKVTGEMSAVELERHLAKELESLGVKVMTLDEAMSQGIGKRPLAGPKKDETWN